MQITSTFRRQHKELMVLAGEVLALLEPSRVRVRTHEVVVALARFSGKLKMHAAMENQALYPALFADEDEDVQRAARALFAEVGDLYRHFERHAKRWSTAEVIAADAEAFVTETAEFLRLLGARMMRENSELYPLVEERARKRGEGE
jgi:hemerythrin-like domain-containing protein